jgi:hypothetical protein
MIRGFDLIIYHPRMLMYRLYPTRRMFLTSPLKRTILHVRFQVLTAVSMKFSLLGYTAV